MATRKYTRGKDEIDLDLWLNEVSNRWETFKNDLVGRTYIDSTGEKKKITEKDIPYIKLAYNDIFQRLDSGDNSLTYIYNTSDKGFNDTKGLLPSNSYYGIAAKHFGNVLRDMKVYSDPNKIKYSDGAIGTALNRRLLGSTGTIQSFIDRDPYDTKAKTRNNTIRTKDIRNALQGIYDDWKSGNTEFIDFTPEDQEKGLKDIESLFTVIDNDGLITEDEYLQLEKITGLKDIRKMLSTGEQTAPIITDQNGTVTRLGRTYADFIKWVSTHYKPYTGSLIAPLSLANDEKYGDYAENVFTQGITNSPTQALHSFLQRVINQPNYNVNLDELITNLFPTFNTLFSTLYVLDKVLNNLKNRTDGLYNFGTSDLGKYYIPGTRTTNNTGFVWDVNANTINEMSIHDIPYWKTKILNEWNSNTDGEDLDPILTSAYPRFKEGGILFALSGNVMEGRNLLENQNNNKWLSIENTEENANNIELWDNFYKLSDIVSDTVNNNSWESATDLATKLKQLDQLGSNLSWDKIVNDTGYKEWNELFDLTGLNKYFGKDSSKFDYIGPSTWNRHALLNKLRETFNKDNKLTIGDQDLYWNGYEWSVSLTNPNKLKANNNLTSKLVINFKKPIIIPETNTDREQDKESFGSKFLNTTLNLIPELINTGRLFHSLNTNNRVAKVIKPSLTPVLKDTYERYSPVTGAFSSMLLKNSQGADALFLALRPFTSDASLASARMFEGQKYANELQTQGFIADDKEIKRTQNEALLRQEDNMARRSAIANDNRAAINKSNREVALLEATRLNKNWKSVDNFLDGLKSTATNLRDKRLAFAETVADDNAKREYENMIAPANKALTDWLNSPEGKDKPITEWPMYSKYTRFMQEAADRYTTSRLSGNAKVNYYNYKNPYANSKLLDWTTFFKNGGIIKQLDFISQIVKLNNERNS